MAGVKTPVIRECPLLGAPPEYGHMARTITPELLRQQLASDEPPTVVDTRDRASYETWHIPGAKNYPYKPDEPLDIAALREDLGIEPEEKIVTICSKAKSSSALARALADDGFADVAIVQDGMRGWSRLYEVAAIPTVATGLEIFQVQRVANGCLSYVIGAPRAGDAVVVDPGRHIDEYTAIATGDDLDIVGVVDTHIHADHLSGGRALADEVGAPYYLPATAANRVDDIEYEPLGRNEVLPVGDVDLKAISTSGHTTDSTSLVVGGEAVLTGDTLFVDSVGRTELQFGDAGATEGAEQLYESIHGSLLVLPDGIAVLPGHFDPEREDAIAGITDPITSEIGTLRTNLPLLQADKTSFVERIVDAAPEKPRNYERVIAINTGQDSPEDSLAATELELGPNRCAVSPD